MMQSLKKLFENFFCVRETFFRRKMFCLYPVRFARQSEKTFFKYVTQQKLFFSMSLPSLYLSYHTVSLWISFGDWSDGIPK